MTPSVFEAYKPLIDKTLENLFDPETDSVLEKAMSYSALAKGKRLRPILALCGYRIAGGDTIEDVLIPASALELLHSYSLIHDDLPAMDNDDLRRGIPTNHKVFGDAVAILAGDALQTMGAYLLSVHPKGGRYRSRRLKALDSVLGAIGHQGMAKGQTIDISTKPGLFDESALLEMHRLKTGCLLEASVLSGAIWAGASRKILKILSSYASPLGIAFQLADDILDETSTPEKLGKTPGKDKRDRKTTLVSLWGMNKSKKELENYLSGSLRALAPLGDEAQDLRDIARFIVQRDY